MAKDCKMDLIASFRFVFFFCFIRNLISKMYQKKVIPKRTTTKKRTNKQTNRQMNKINHNFHIYFLVAKPKWGTPREDASSVIFLYYI